MEKYVPGIYKKSIYDVDYKKLKSNGIKCILFDLDNTIVPYNIKEPNKKVMDLFKQIKSLGIKIIIFSNSGKKRLKPFKDMLEVDCCPRAFKPSPEKFVAIIDGYKYALDNDYDIAIQYDGDGQHDVSYVEKLIEPIINKNVNIITYGFNYKSTVTVSSNREENLVICIQRAINGIHGKEIEQQEIISQNDKEKEANQKIIEKIIQEILEK